MHLGEKIAALFARFGETVPIQREETFLWFFTQVKTRGYLSIESKEDHWFVMFLSDKDSHNPLTGPAYGIEVRKDSGERYKGFGFIGVWKSAISMWPIREEEEAVEVFDRLKGKIEMVYDFHLAQAPSETVALQAKSA